MDLYIAMAGIDDEAEAKYASSFTNLHGVEGVGMNSGCFLGTE